MADLRIQHLWRIFSSFCLLLHLLFTILTVSQSHQTTEFCDVGFEYSKCGSPSSSSKILIKGGTVVNAHHLEIADVYIEQGIIASVRQNIQDANATIRELQESLSFDMSNVKLELQTMDQL